MWTLVLPPGLQAALAPLVEAHARTGPVRVVVADDPDRDWPDHLPAHGSLLVVGAPRRGARAVLPGVLTGPGRVVLGRVGTGPGLPAWVRAAAVAAGRSGALGPVALLGGRDARVDRALSAAEAGAAVPVLRWDARRVGGPALPAALAAGPALAAYLGHGLRQGWTGYGGVDARTFRAPGPVLAAVLSLTCSTGSRAAGPSFAEQVLATGRVGAVLAAPGRVRHDDDALALHLLVGALRPAGPAPVLADLLREAALPERVLRQYRVHGDPGVPLGADEGAAAACAAVPAPHPDAAPPPLVAV